MGNQQGQAFDDLRNTISECTRVVRHRWRLAVVGLSLVSTIAFWYSQYLPREYAAGTIFERRDDVVLQNLIQGNSPYGFDHLKTTMKLDMIGSRALAKAAERLELVPPGTFANEGALTEHERRQLDGALGKYRLRPTMRLMHSSSSLDTIQLRCEANDPNMARLFVIALRDNYIEDTRARIREILTSTKDFFETEAQRLKERVSQAEDALQAGFEEFPGLDPTDPVSVGNRLETIQAQYNVAAQRRAEIAAQIEAREQFLQSGPEYLDLEEQPAAKSQPQHPLSLPPRIVDPALDDRIGDVRRRIVELKAGKRMTDEHPQVRSLYEELAALESLRNSVLAAAPAPRVMMPVPGPTTQPRERSKAYREWMAQQMRVELELDALRRQYEIARAEADKLGERVENFGRLHEQLLAKGDELRRLREMQTEGEQELAIWESHLARLDRVLAAESGQRGTQFTLIEEPKNVSRPIRPRVASIFAVCSGLGVAAAALVIALAELFDRSYRSISQVTRSLGLPVLESVGVIPTPREKRRAALARMIWTPTLGVLLALLALSASLAYASLEMPGFHARTLERVDRVLGTETAQERASDVPTT